MGDPLDDFLHDLGEVLRGRSGFKVMALIQSSENRFEILSMDGDAVWQFGMLRMGDMVLEQNFLVKVGVAEPIENEVEGVPIEKVQ